MADLVEWRGSTRELEMLEEALDRLADPKLWRDFLSEVSDEALKMVRAEFEASADPYGKKWAPFVQKKDRLSGRKILKKTGKLKDSIKKSLNRDGFRLYSADSRFGFFQFGTKRMKQRMIFPAEVSTRFGEWTISTSDTQGDPGAKMDILMQRALMRVLERYDVDIFAEAGGVSVFERQKNFRDDY